MMKIPRSAHTLRVPSAAKAPAANSKESPAQLPDCQLIHTAINVRLDNQKYHANSRSTFAAQVLAPIIQVLDLTMHCWWGRIIHTGEDLIRIPGGKTIHQEGRA